MLATEAVTWFREGQHYFNDLVVTYLEAIRQEGNFAAYAGLGLVGFLYGVIHAVGPGHGKMIVSSYVLANENSLRRGLLVVALSSLLQAVTAIALVFGFYHLLAATRAQAEHLAGLLETASYVMIGGLGLWFTGQGIAAFARVFGLSLKPQGRRAQPEGHGHSHHHDHGHECGCGHAHAPAPEKLKGKKDFASLAVMIVSVGIRPCTGALLLLFFSCLFDLAGPGAVATLAMSLGTALTTGALAVLAVKSKALALSLVKRSDRWMALAHAGLRLCGGIVILLMAALFLTAQLGAEDTSSPARHPLYRNFR